MRLSDPVDVDGEGLVNMEFSSGTGFPDYEAEEWTPEFAITKDLAYVDLRCYERPRGRPDDDVLCRLYPLEGNSGSIHLEAAVAQSVADTAGQMSRRALFWQYAWNDPRVHRYNSFLYPIINDGSGDPADPGPCLEVTRAG